MVKLESQDTTFGGVFYFHNMNDCREFLYVFKDHWCNVPWKTPIEISENISIAPFQKHQMDISPKKRAENNLSWGFNLMDRLGIGFNDKQNDFIKSIVNGI